MKQEDATVQSTQPEVKIEKDFECWAVECYEQRGFIPLGKVRRIEILLTPDWPANFETDCPFCKRPHRYIKQEVELKILRLPPTNNFPKIRPIR